MAKFKVDAFRLKKELINTKVFSDVVVYKDQGYIKVIAVRDGLLIWSDLSYRYRSFKDFDTQGDVDKAIKAFIDKNIKQLDEDDEA